MCKSHVKDYIGHCTTTLRRRLVAHRNHGAIHQHFVDVHDRKPTVQELIENTQVVHKESNYGRLIITEAVSITIQKPTLNIQQEADNTLPSCRGRRRMQGNNAMPLRQVDNDERPSNEAQVSALLRSLRPRINGRTVTSR